MARRKQLDLKIRAIPVQLSANHPAPPHDILPYHEFTAGLIAPKGSGKTTLICNLLEFYSGFFHTIIIFSPTLHSDDKWDYVRKQPLLAENSALENFINEIDRRSNNTIVAPHRNLDNYIQSKEEIEESTFTGIIPDDCFLSEYDDTILQNIMTSQQNMIAFLEKNGKTKHLANRILFIFDDLVGSSLFSSKRKSPFKTLNTNHRHYSASLLQVTQAYKEMQKTVRTQFSCLMTFEIPNARELLVIYEENTKKILVVSITPSGSRCTSTPSEKTMPSSS
jgi:hypothetical protein